MVLSPRNNVQCPNLAGGNPPVVVCKDQNLVSGLNDHNSSVLRFTSWPPKKKKSVPNCTNEMARLGEGAGESESILFHLKISELIKTTLTANCQMNRPTYRSKRNSHQI